MKAISGLEGNPTVNEVVALNQEMDAMLSTATPEEREWLLTEFDSDPTYRAAVYGRDVIAQVAGLISLRSTEVEPTPVAQLEVSTDELLADLEQDNEAVARQAEVQKADIAGIHDLLDKYSIEHGPKPPTKKAQAQLARLLGGEFKEHWNESDLADDPMRLKNVLESIASKEDTSLQVKAAVRAYILEKIKKYVAETAQTVDPEVIGRRTEASLLPGPAAEDLQKILLGTYFKKAEGYARVEDAIDNFERFAIGVITQLGNKPELARTAFDILSFQTPLLPGDSLYAFQILNIPMLRVDRPELFGRIYAILTTLARMAGAIEILDSLGKRDNLPFKSLAEVGKEVEKNGMKRSTLRKAKRNYGMPTAVHYQIAMDVLGEDEYQRRKEVMYDFQDLIFDEDSIARLISERFGSGEGVLSLMSYVGEYLKTKHPESGEFIDELVNADTPINKILSSGVGDVGFFGNKSTIENEKTKSLFAHLERYLLADEAPENISELINDPRGLMEFVRDQTKVVNRPTDDGYMLEFILPAYYDLGEEDVSALTALFADKIEKAKQTIAGMPAAGRQAYTIEDKENRILVNVRPQNEHDRKAYHSLDRMLGEPEPASEDFDPEEALAESLAEIEQCRQDILLERRRFLNERGIYYSEIQGDTTLKLTFKKHPRNPQYFVCQIDLKDSERAATSKVLMAPDLRFDLGGKKVRDNVALAYINSIAAEILAHFMCEEAVETEEGKIGDENNVVTARIAHLRLLPEGQNYSYKQWEKCLEAEGLDLDVLSSLQQIKYDTDRKSTYVGAVERDDLSLGPLRVYLPEVEDEQAA